MREAAVMLIVKDGLILSISRRDDKTKFGLPGGKVEPGETLWQAAMRETLEETSVTVTHCVEIFRREEVAPSGEVFYTCCYYANLWAGEPKDSEEGVVKWLTDEELTITHGAFADYNRATIDILKLKYPNIIIK